MKYLKQKYKTVMNTDNEENVKSKGSKNLCEAGIKE